MQGFRLHGVGEYFDVDFYLSRYEIDYDSVWHRDEQHQNSGFVKYLGNEYELDVYEQEKIAYRYMQTNKKLLQALVNRKDIDVVILGLSYRFEVFPTVGTCLSFSPATIALAAEIGLELAFYVEAFISENYYEDCYTPSAEEY